MNNLLITALWLSLSGSLFILALCFCKPMFRHKLGKGWQYYIWLVVIARLLLPFSSEVNLLGNAFERMESKVTTGVSVQETLNEPIPDITTPHRDYNNILPLIFNSNDQTDSSIVPETHTTSLAQQFNKALSVVLSNVWLVWLMVAIILLIRKMTIYQSFIRYIKAGRTEVSDIEHLEMLGILLEQLKIKRTVGLYTNSLVSSPLLIGFFRPCIILPTTKLSDADFRNTILHELIHYKRHDMFYKWLVQLTICLHWFNPLIYLMGREINRACELSCDEAVIAKLNPQEQKAYGDTLLNALAMGSYHQSIASLSLKESKENIKERLDSIMNFKKKSVFIRCATLILTLIFMCGFAVTGAYEASNGNQKQTYISRTDSLKQSFERYKAFGVIYNATQNAVYYNGERVKLFVEFKSYKEEGMTYAFDLCYEDSKTDSTLYLEAVKDSSGKIIAIRPLKPRIVNELLSVNTTNQQTQNTNEFITEIEETFVFTMDATQVFENYGITAKDLTKDKVGAPIKDWINQCDKNKGAYVLKTEEANKYTTYIYYNGGGRYPWNMRVDDGKIIVYLYSNSKLATTDGYYLMYFTASKNYSDISLYLDNTLISFSNDNKKNSTPWLSMGNGDGQPYVYSQSGYFQDGYIFEMGWNLYEKGYNAYPDRKTLTLADKSKITVSFDATCKNSIKQPEVLTALTALLDRLKPQAVAAGVPLEKPLVVGVEYVGDKDVIKLAEEYYNNGENTSLSAIFFALDKKSQEVYFNKMIDDNKLSLFAAILQANEISDDMIDKFAKKAYSSKKLTFFSVIAPYMTDSEKQAWVVKSSQDKRVTFLEVLKEHKS